MRKEMNNVDAAISEVERRTRDLARSDLANSSVNNDQDANHAAKATEVEQTGSLMAALAEASVEQVQRIIDYLSSARDLLAVEAQRFQAEVSRYRLLSQATLEAMKFVDSHMQGLAVRSTSEEMPDDPSAKKLV